MGFVGRAGPWKPGVANRDALEEAWRSLFDCSVMFSRSQLTLVPGFRALLHPDVASSRPQKLISGAARSSGHKNDGSKKIAIPHTRLCPEQRSNFSDSRKNQAGQQYALNSAKSVPARPGPSAED